MSVGCVAAILPFIGFAKPFHASVEAAPGIATASRQRKHTTYVPQPFSAKEPSFYHQ